MPSKAKPSASNDVEPDRRALTIREAEYLAEEAHIDIEKLIDRPIGELDEILRWRIDPWFLLFRKICGRVVRRNPVTGAVEGVPNATVHVLDTDSSFLGYFPIGSPYWWHWPLWHRTEEIGTTTTDACGRFCVWIPRWDIDRILRFRRRRVCFGDILRPNIRDLLDDIVWTERPPIPNPPDPGPLGPLAGFDLHHLPVVAERLGEGAAEQVRIALTNRTFGAPTADIEQLLETPVPRHTLPPPLSAEALDRVGGALPDEVHERLADELKAETKGRKSKADDALSIVDRIHPDAFHGPFIRCVDLIVPEWVTVLDVPDITFRVTQDVDLDGDEEVIYSEGLFDVRWDAGPMPPVVLEASAIARSTPFCDAPIVLCGNTPAIRTVGLMPLEPTHHDLATGVATRVNRPRDVPGLSASPRTSPASSPYAGTLQLHGCARIGSAQFYRLVYDFTGPGGTTVSNAPFTGLEWWAPRLGAGAPFHIVADGDGWYPLLPAADLVFPNWLLSWPTGSFADGRYDVHLEVADGAKTMLSSSPVVAFRTDNTRPAAVFDEIRWGLSAAGPFPVANRLPDVCPVISRTAGTDLFLQVRWSVSAAHLLVGSLVATGCGGGAPEVLDPEGNRYHWHTSPGDNAFSRTAIVRIPGSSPAGCYDIGIDAWSRAFNPAGDGGGPGTNWLTDSFHHGSFPRRGIAVIDA